MKMLSLEPDDDMKWIYDPSHPDYNTASAKHLRLARDRAIASAPKWIIEEARLNDLVREQHTHKEDLSDSTDQMNSGD